ncbi:MAG TPA: FAD-dependent oxidoreductase [Phycisphaerales bacterium]|nr:FAD-dependent oxidoreductase [Phycisphaerales bacterium]
METGGTHTLWGDEPLNLHRSQLTQNTTADVCIIGAGLAGILCAYALAREGRRVIVLEALDIGSGETGRTTAHLTNAIDDRYFHIEQMHGAEAARITAESHTQGISFLERIAMEEAIPCGFTRLDGYLFLPPGEKPELLQRELDAAHRAGLGAVERVDKVPSFESGPALRFPDQAQFSPMRFLAGVAHAAERLGASIHTGTQVDGIDKSSSLTVRTRGGSAVECGAVIVATNAPINDVVTMHMKQAAYRTYALAAPVAIDPDAKALLWDTSERAGDPDGPYHYVRFTSSDPNGRLTNGTPPRDFIIVGGGDHPTGIKVEPVERWNTLERWARERWPSMGTVVHRWSGQVLEPHDAVAFIGRNPTGPDGVYIVTGDSGMGMTHSAIAAILLPRLIAGEDHPWKKLYDPARKPVHGLADLARHVGRVTANYAEWVSPGEEARSLSAGDGLIVRHGLKLLAVCRDEQGRLHSHHAACTHLGCVVHWNSAEKSWDCPCHGSRFSAAGEVISGPAIKDLESAPIDGATPEIQTRPIMPTPSSAPI